VALEPLFFFLVISWWCGLLVPCVGLYLVLFMKSGRSTSMAQMQKLQPSEPQFPEKLMGF
jgi:hypothetical protein